MVRLQYLSVYKNKSETSKFSSYIDCLTGKLGNLSSIDI